MSWFRSVVWLAVWTLSLPLAVAQPPWAAPPWEAPRRPAPPRDAPAWGAPRRAAPAWGTSVSSAQQWARQLESELVHLQEDFYYGRGNYSRDLRNRAERAAAAVIEFQQVLNRADPDNLLREFQQMDRRVHELVEQLENSRDGWLRRQAAQISYADEQLHYALQMQRQDGRRGGVSRELLARHARTLEYQARNLERAIDYAYNRDDDDDRLRDVVEEFADDAADFYEDVREKDDLDRLRKDFEEVDDMWNKVVSRLNRSAQGIYVRQIANDVNRVHNQIHSLVHSRWEEPHQFQHRRVLRQDRPVIRLELPGVGAIQFPR